jgi:hypothetical protein
MVEIELDLFSGRPNPRWEVSGADGDALVDAIAATPVAWTGVDEGFTGLGPRGLRVTVGSEADAAARSLPPTVRVAGGGAQDDDAALALAERLLATGPELEPDQRQELLGQFAQAQRIAATWSPPPPPAAPADQPEAGADADAPPPPLTTVADGSCAVELGVLNLPFWNGNAYWRENNNCYAYGTNRRTNTFPQPGRGGGQMFTDRTQAAVITAVLLDGGAKQTYCQPSARSPRWLCALVTTPDRAWNWDYHWYRKQTSGVWGHKPGKTMAQIYDNAGRVITDPQTADRGRYTQWGGYFYAPSSMIIA